MNQVNETIFAYGMVFKTLPIPFIHYHSKLSKIQRATLLIKLFYV